MRRRLLYAAIVTAFLAAYIGGILALRATNRAEQLKQAKGVELTSLVCFRAHSELNGDSEEACGLAQTVTNTEFLCSHGKSACWVEQK
jgi:hypothetical protein